MSISPPIPALSDRKTGGYIQCIKEYIIMKYIAYGVEAAKADRDLITRIEELAPDYTVLPGNSLDDFTGKLDEIEIAFRDIGIETLLAMKNLKWFQAWSAGVDNLMADPRVLDSRFTITNTRGIHPVQMAEHIFSLLLSLSRGMNYSWQLRTDHSWKQVPASRLFELEGKTMLILGAGAIGRRTATIAKAFGMRVIAARRSDLDRLGPFDEVVPWEAFREYLESADVVLNILPLTPETEGLIGAQEFGRMGAETVFLNVGRGKTVNQVALIDALRRGVIACAGLDVADPEPLPAESPLWDLENVVMTGHYAGITPRYDERGNELFLRNLGNYTAGKELQNIVDRNRGY
jgi:phosphoglycerate dehydrogenase-like enzyme